MVRPLPQAEFAPFFDLLGEVENGSHYDRAIHRDWLGRALDQWYGTGLRFFARYLPDGGPAGFISLKFDARPGGKIHMVEIIHLGVSSQCRRQGHASELLNFATTFARDLPAHCLYVSTYAGNTAAVICYVRNGFVPVATLPDMHGPNDEGQMYLRKLLHSGPGVGC